MDPKHQFGVDFFYLCRILDTAKESEKYLMIDDILAFLLLSFWDFTYEEINKSYSVFIDLVGDDQIINDKAYRRMVNHFRNQSKENKLKFIKQLSALSLIDGKSTDSEVNFLESFIEGFDLRPTEVYEAAQQGSEIAYLLNIFAESHAREMIKIEGEIYLNHLLGKAE
jgi:hypothetical protein